MRRDSNGSPDDGEDSPLSTPAWLQKRIDEDRWDDIGPGDSPDESPSSKWESILDDNDELIKLPQPAITPNTTVSPVDELPKEDDDQERGVPERRKRHEWMFPRGYFFRQSGWLHRVISKLEEGQKKTNKWAWINAQVTLFCWLIKHEYRVENGITEDGFFYAQSSTIKAELNMEADTQRVLLKRLEEHGLIERSIRDDPKTGRKRFIHINGERAYQLACALDE